MPRNVPRNLPPTHIQILEHSRRDKICVVLVWWVPGGFFGLVWDPFNVFDNLQWVVPSFYGYFNKSGKKSEILAALAATHCTAWCCLALGHLG